jgi:hypothetical protein
MFTTCFGNSKQVHVYNIQSLIFNISDTLLDEQSFSVCMHIITLDVRTKMYKSPYELTNAIPLIRLSLVGVILTEILLILTLNAVYFSFIILQQMDYLLIRFMCRQNHVRTKTQAK